MEPAGANMNDGIIVHNLSDDDFVALLCNTAIVMGGQAILARHLGISPAAINQIIKGRYRARLDRMKVLAVKKLNLRCPILGIIGITECRVNIQAARGESWPSDPQLTRLYQACLDCSLNKEV